jgi:hypothetical protein
MFMGAAWVLLVQRSMMKYLVGVMDFNTWNPKDLKTFGI